jgi:hypothetical protein
MPASDATPEKQPPNLLHFRPNHKVTWEQDTTGFIVLLVPKFKNRFLAKYVLPRLKKPNYKIKLDEFGSWVWKEIDGEKSVYDIGLGLQSNFGDKVEPVFPRLGQFINSMARYKFITLRPEF